MAQPLEGIRVVDFSHVVAGPLATHFLALLGADVVKVEPPAGDALRNYTLDPAQRGMAPAFMGINLGKRSVVLDLKSDAGRRAAQKLAAGADVLVENFRPGVMARLGLGYDALAAVNPGLVYCSVSGFGQDGPMRDMPAIDQIVQSLSGLMGLSGLPGDPPMRIGIPIVDTFTGLLAAFAIQSALLQRARHGGGQVIDVAMLDATLVMMLSVVNPLLIAGEQPVRTGNRGFSRAPTADTFATADGQITIGAVEPATVDKLLDALGLGQLRQDPRFADRDARIANAEALSAELASAFRTRTTAEWVEKLNAASVPAAPVSSLAEAVALPQVATRGLRMKVSGGRGEHEALNAGFRFRHGGPGITRGAPLLGEHTDEVLETLADPVARGRAAR
jgi:crotonobetainyl-CoA:carnitine CoA-transferase CaiB-like acyl-CoA transferase